jgi:hypothetical protein
VPILLQATLLSIIDQREDPHILEDRVSWSFFYHFNLVNPLQSRQCEHDAGGFLSTCSRVGRHDHFAGGKLVFR